MPRRTEAARVRQGLQTGGELREWGWGTAGHTGLGLGYLCVGSGWGHPAPEPLPSTLRSGLCTDLGVVQGFSVLETPTWLATSMPTATKGEGQEAIGARHRQDGDGCGEGPRTWLLDHGATLWLRGLGRVTSSQPPSSHL